MGYPAEGVRYRFGWTFPLTISPHNHEKVYVGSQHVHVTTDGGRSWQMISPDLTLNDKTRQGISGGLTPDNIGVEYAGVIFAIAESPVQEGLIWVGTNDGLVHVTHDGGGSWTNITSNIPNLPPWGTISNIKSSRFDAGTAYITVDFHQMNNRDPFVYKTSDYGRTWELIVNGIPKSPFSYAHWIEEDPVRRGLLYLGTENALFVSFDDGNHWVPLQNNLPHAPVYGIIVQEHFNDLVVATYGRGFWILDDLTPLQQLTSEVASRPAHLFAPRPAYRYRNITSRVSMSNDPTSGTNTPYGASINYWLKSHPRGQATIIILDATGKPICTIQSPAKLGINRIWWDLRFEPSKRARLRTSPLYAPEIGLGPGGWLAGPGGLSILAPPGRYQVKLTVDGQEFTQPLMLLKDPHSGGNEQEILAQTNVLLDLQKDMDDVVDMINAVELVRSQLQTLGHKLNHKPRNKYLRDAADSLKAKFIDLEENLHQLRVTGRGSDMVRWPAKLGAQIMYLFGDIGSSDFAPTAQHREVQAMLKEQLGEYQRKLEELLSRDLAAFNNLLSEQKIPKIISKFP
jgi:hypothetical protein